MLTRHPVLSSLLLTAALTAAPPATAQPADSHTVFDLVANADLAHLVRQGGLAVDAGAWSFPRYVDGDVRARVWRFGVQDGDRKLAVSVKRKAFLYLPVAQQQLAGATSLRVRVLPARAGATLGASLNGRALEKKKLSKGWQTVVWALPAGAAVGGENRLEFDFGRTGKVLGRSGAAAIAWLHLGPEQGEAPPLLDLRPGPGRLAIPAGGGALDWYVFVPRDTTAVVQLRGEAVAGCEVVLALEGGAEPLQARGAPSLAGTTLRLEPAALANKAARLQVRASEACRQVEILAGSGLTLAGPAPVFKRSAPPPERVILYIIDTLRADRLKAYNPSSRVQTPALDRLSAEGATFMQAYAQGNESYVSHAAIFTGQYPRSSGIWAGGRKLRAPHLLVSEALKAAGMTTAGLTSNGYIDVRNGYLQGWNHYVNTLVSKRPYLAPGLLKQVRAWTDRHLDERFFLYVGPVDPHVSYRAHKGIIERYDPGPYRGPYRRVCSGGELGKIKAKPSRVRKRDRARVEALYDNEVDYSDVHLGRFLEYLTAKGLLDTTLLLVTSDHGDEFWEHGSVGHGHSLYDELVHVPLIIRYPPLFAAGTRIAEGVELVDIFPTLVDAVGAPAPAGVQGASLLPLANGVGRGYPRPSAAMLGRTKYAMRLAHYKLHLGRGGRRKLFDVAADPTEQTDVLATHPHAARWLADAASLLVAYETEWDKRTWGVSSNLSGKR